MTRSMDGKVVIVTGGSTGIGEATAQAFAREGAKVVVANDRNVEGGERVAQAIRAEGGEALFVQADVSRADQVEALVNTTVTTYGRLDYAVNNAGYGGRFANTVDFTEEEWDQI